MSHVGDFACIRIDQNVFCKSLCNEAGGYATRLLVLGLVEATSTCRRTHDAPANGLWCFHQHGLRAFETI
jgi:hypothetical protein